MAVSDVTYHACSSSAPLPALAHLGCPGRCCGSSRTRPAALGLEESSREIKKELLGGAVNIHPCSDPFGPTLAVAHFCETLLPSGTCQQSPTPTGRHGTAQDAALEVMAQLSTTQHQHKPTPGSPPSWGTSRIMGKYTTTGHRDRSGVSRVQDPEIPATQDQDRVNHRDMEK